MERLGEIEQLTHELKLEIFRRDISDQIKEASKMADGTTSSRDF